MNLRFKIILLIGFLLVAGEGVPQKRMIRKGDRAYREQHYQDALRFYKRVKSKDELVLRNMAGSYFCLGEMDLAERYYNRIAEGVLEAEDLVHLCRIRLSQGRYDEAQSYMIKAREAGADPIFVKNQIEGIEWAKAAMQQTQKYELQETGIRLGCKSFGLQFYNSDLVYSRKMRPGKRKKGVKYHQIFRAKSEGDAYTSGRALDPKLDPKKNLGGVAFSADGKTMLYTIRYQDKKGKTCYKIMQARLEGKRWKKQGPLSINGKDFSCAFPALAPDDHTLYFSSDRPGSFGGMDLYVAYRSGTSWTDPENLGEMVNTPGNEIYPFLSDKDKLWFASDGHIGMGGLDVFYSIQNSAGEWAKPMNPGPPVNSSLNDYSCIRHPDLSAKAYLVSDRMDGGSKDRIFQVRQLRKEIFKVVVKDELTEEAIRTAQVRVIRASDQKEIGELNSGNLRGEYFFELNQRDVQQGILLRVSAKEQRYQPKEVEYKTAPDRLKLEMSLTPLTLESEYRFVVRLQPTLYPDRKLVFRNLYFQSNNAELSIDSRAVLDRLVTLLEAFPHLKLKLNAHTDSRGLEEYNQKLSEKRALLARNYLVERGIDSDKILVNGYGEKYILNGCVDGIYCSSEEHRYNRRIEVILVL